MCGQSSQKPELQCLESSLGRKRSQNDRPLTQADDMINCSEKDHESAIGWPTVIWESVRRCISTEFEMS